MSKYDLQDVNNIVEGVIGVPIEEQEINKSIEELHNNIDLTIKRLAKYAYLALETFIKFYKEPKYKDNFIIKPVFDSYGKGVEISWVSSKKEESMWSFAKTFKDIQTLNFMDFYQRFNKNEYIEDSIKKFTKYFKNEFHKACNPNTEQAINYLSGVTDDMISFLGMGNDRYEVIISRQEITQTIKTLKDSISDSEIFMNKPEVLELITKDKNKSHDSTIVIDKITIYRDK